MNEPMNEKNALIVFSVGPVQSFIASARKTEDLWAGSYTLSYLIKLAIETAEAQAREIGVFLDVVFPARRQKTQEVTMTASYPNRFLASIKGEPETAAQVAKACEQAVREAIKSMAAKSVDKVFGHFHTDEVSRIKDMALLQASCFFEVYWALEPWDGKDYLAAAQRLEGRLAASKNERPLSFAEQSGLVCTVCGERDALGQFAPESANYAQMKRDLAKIWSKRAQAYNKPPAHEDAPDPEGRIKEGEYLCGICLMKRTARDYFGDVFRQRSVFKPFPSTREIAMPFGVGPAFRKEKESDEGGYFAVIMMDGDSMGEWLSGVKLPSWGQDIRANTAQGKDWGLAYQNALSERMHQFAHKSVPDLIREQKGTLVYCGGDDVLALLSVRDALSFAYKLRQVFSDEQNGLGSDFTASMGLVIAHEKEPLQNVLRWARRMESAAKDYTAAQGRYQKNALGIAVIAHSGEIRETVVPWSWPEQAASAHQSPAEVLLEVLRKSYEHLSYSFVEHFASSFLPVMNPSRLQREKLRIMANSEMNRKLLTTELFRLLQRSSQEEKVSARDLKNMAEMLATLHEILPTSLQFIHLLETLRFFKREEVMGIG